MDDRFFDYFVCEALKEIRIIITQDCLCFSDFLSMDVLTPISSLSHVLDLYME
jgi:hypothetical protein